MFIVGNLASVAGIAYEIAELDVCFDEKLGDDDFTDDKTPEENADGAYANLWFLFIVGLWVDVFSAVSLSAVYRTPLDIKSAHKIPPGDVRNPQMVAIVNFLAPFSWSVVYLCGGYASQDFGDNLACGGGAGGSGLAEYLRWSGVLMVIFGWGMLLLAAFMVKAACSCCCCCCCCCEPRTPHGVHPTQVVRTPPRVFGITWSPGTMNKRVLSKSKFFDLGWHLQGAVVSYRIGALGLIEAVLVGLFGGLGAALAELGSLAPREVQEIVGPVAL